MLSQGNFNLPYTAVEILGYMVRDPVDVLPPRYDDKGDPVKVRYTDFRLRVVDTYDPALMLEDRRMGWGAKKHPTPKDPRPHAAVNTTTLQVAAWDGEKWDGVWVLVVPYDDFMYRDLVQTSNPWLVALREPNTYELAVGAKARYLSMVMKQPIAVEG
jgi:hypothetical protein